MNTYESLEDEAYKNKVNIVNYPFSSQNIKGLYVDNHIAINNSISTYKERSCILAEELGHHHTTVGNILDQSNSNNRKQEYKARLWGFNRLIGLIGIVKAFESGCKSRYEMANYLDVTEEYLQECLDCYKSKYGTYTTLDNYVIYFIPNLAVAKMF